MVAERYECTTGHNKFWEVEVKANILIVHFGRIGTNGQQSQKEFETEKEALAARDKMVKEKLGKGYNKVDAGTSSKAGAIVYRVYLEPGSASNEGFVITELLNYCLRHKFTSRQVDKGLRKVIDLIEDADLGDSDFEELVGAAVRRVFKKFNYKKTANKARRDHYDQDPEPDEFRQVCEETNLDQLYEKAIQGKADGFIFHNEGGAGYSILAVKGQVTEKEIEDYIDKDNENEGANER